MASDAIYDCLRETLSVFFNDAGQPRRHAVEAPHTFVVRISCQLVEF